MPRPLLYSVSWDVEGEHRPIPQGVENSNKGRRRGGGEKEGGGGRGAKLSSVGLQERSFKNALSLCAIIFPIAQVRNVRIST